MIDEYDLGGGRLEAFVHVEGSPDTGHLAMAIQPGLPERDREMRELEAHGYKLLRLERGVPRQDRYCLKPRSMRDVDHVTVAAIRRVVDELKPDWVDTVRHATRISFDPRWLSAFSGLRVEAVLAILRNLEERNEI